MNRGLNAYLADTIIRDRIEDAERSRSRRRSQLDWSQRRQDPYDVVTVRRARPGDGPALARLAQLDGRQLDPGPVLVAEVAGRALAARSLTNGAAIADPFQPTAHLVELLELRSAHLREADETLRRRPGRARTWLRALTAQAR
jgi:hypothetical protein